MGLVMKLFIQSFLRDESGAAAAEYALILAIVGAGIAVAAGNLQRHLLGDQHRPGPDLRHLRIGARRAPIRSGC